MKRSTVRAICFSILTVASVFTTVSTIKAQTENRAAAELYSEVADYVNTKTKELRAEGVRVDQDKRDVLARERKALAAKHAATLAARGEAKGVYVYYLASLYEAAEADAKAIETFKQFLAQYSPETKGDAIQSARTRIVVIASRKKPMFAEAEQAFQAWLKGSPLIEKQRPTLEGVLASASYRHEDYETAVRYAASAFANLKALEAQTLSDRRAKTELYGNLIEILALAHRKTKNTDQALNVLAEGRALSFTIPSANLYRKVMEIVGGSGFSEKKLMQKVESLKNAQPAPEMQVEEWLGQEPATLEAMRGKVVLLDFWATWCGPCISTFPRLREWHKKYSPNGLAIVGVTEFEGKKEDRPMTALQELEYLRDFKTKHKLPYGFAVSKRGECAAKYDVNAFPTTVLLDRSGVIRYIGIGAGAEEIENLNETIQKLLKEQN